MRRLGRSFPFKGRPSRDFLWLRCRYDIRQSQTHLTTLQAEISATRAKLVPKKKFTFKSRKSKNPAPTPASGSAAASDPAGPAAANGAGAGPADDRASSEQPSTAGPAEGEPEANKAGVSSLTGETVVMLAEQVSAFRRRGYGWLSCCTSSKSLGGRGGGGRILLVTNSPSLLSSCSAIYSNDPEPTVIHP